MLSGSVLEIAGLCRCFQLRCRVVVDEPNGTRNMGPGGGLDNSDAHSELKQVVDCVVVVLRRRP